MLLHLILSLLVSVLFVSVFKFRDRYHSLLRRLLRAISRPPHYFVIYMKQRYINYTWDACVVQSDLESDLESDCDSRRKQAFLDVAESPPHRLRCWIYPRNLDIDDTILDIIARSLKRSRWIVLMLGPGFLSNKRCIFTMNAAYKLYPHRTIPVMLEECDMPEWMNCLKPGNDINKLFTKICRIVKQDRE